MQYGITPWGKWFVEILDSYKMGARLDRGRSYANTGKVLSLELEAGKAIAKVKGNYRPFYKVSINFPPLKDAEKVYKMIESDAFLLARIAAGELPETFLEKLKEKDINLIPRRWQEMKRSCTCPDYGDPCKHMAALYYIIAKEIDSDPHVLFKLRGMDMTERFGKAAVHSIMPPFSVTFAEGEKPVTVDTVPLETEAIPQCGELITSLLPESSHFCVKNFALVMAEFYHRCAGYESWEQTEDNDFTDTEHIFSRSNWTIICQSPGPGADAVLQAEDINGNKKRYSLTNAFEQFVMFSSEDGTTSYTFLFYLFKFLNLICSSSAFVPYVLQEMDSLKIVWRPFEALPQITSMLDKLASRECGMLTVSPRFRVSFSGKNASSTNYRTVSGRTVVDILASAYLNEWVRRRFLGFRAAMRKGSGGREYYDLLDLFFSGISVDVSGPAKRSQPVSIDRWLSVLQIDFSAYKYSLNIKDLSKDFTLGANFKFAMSMDVITEDEDGIKKTPLAKIKDIEILRAPVALSNYLPEIRELTASAVRSPSVMLSEVRLMAFLDSAAPLLTRLGLTVNLPKALARELKPRLAVKKKSAESLVKYLDLDALREFEWQIAIGDQTLSLAEFKKLVKEKHALVRFRDGFIKMDALAFARLLRQAQDSTPTLNDFLKAHFTGESVLAFDSKETINRLFKKQDFPVPQSLTGELRPYQIRGYNWVCSLLFSGFGCILADDMGLGKTIQSIAALLRLKEESLLDGVCLVIAPAALMINWEKELGRFAPSLRVSRYHGSGRKFDKKHDVFLTTYQTAVRDAEKLKKEAFSVLLVDEAHLMKNAETRISRTVKQLRSKYRLALSGTPVENRLEDLRSLFDFILPGYLGNTADFKQQYRIPIEVMRNKEKAESLRKITSPFLLRRVKTDKTIIKDLPDKIVTNEYALLEKEQAALYENVVTESMLKSEKCESDKRAALVLSLLTSLKQICDHPRVFDKESPAVSHLSGKALLLLTLLQEILANREKTLIFSQYVETLDCLNRIIKMELGEAALIYHGGLSQNIRADVIEQFQNNPVSRIMLVSLKAGGLGLNLTAASRVIHYDLWYNPAVENQATDRAFRIGQRQTVFVHRFITKNSFEEKIDAMITSKQELAEMTVGSGESWLARMSHTELKALFDR
jgi:SNF2 family DNA or RNA helicase